MSFLSSMMDPLHLFGDSKAHDVPAAPLPPATNADDIAARDVAATEERRRRLAAGRRSTNPTGGLGDTSSPSLAAKSLLGQ